MDVEHHELAVNSVVRGAAAWRRVALPADFDPARFHTLAAVKQDRTFVFLVDGRRSGLRGHAGRAIAAGFRSFRLFANELGK